MREDLKDEINDKKVVIRHFERMAQTEIIMPRTDITSDDRYKLNELCRDYFWKKLEKAQKELEELFEEVQNE